MIKFFLKKISISKFLSKFFSFVATEGTLHLIKECGDKVLQAVPLLVQPLKLALQTRDPDTIVQVEYFIF